MERKAILLSLGLSLAAMFVVFQYLSQEDEKLRREYGTFFTMVVSTRDILQFETIRPTDIELRQVPAAMAHATMIADPKDVIDAVAAIPITKGEHILDNKIISKNVYSGLDNQIAHGKRAISMPVNPKSAVGYLLRPGNRVDLAAHFEYRTSSSPISETKVFMQDLLVLASGKTIQSSAPRGVDQSLIRELAKYLPKTKLGESPEIRETLTFAKQDANYQTVTLEVTSLQAQQIVYVMSVYADSIILLLRHADDRNLPRLSTTNLYKVLGDDSYLVRGNKAPPRAIPKLPRFYDYVGDEEKAVY